MQRNCGGGGAQRPVCMLMSLKRRVRSVHGRIARPKPTSIERMTDRKASGTKTEGVKETRGEESNVEILGHILHISRRRAAAGKTHSWMWEKCVAKQAAEGLRYSRL